MYRFHRYNLIRWDISSPSVAYKLFVRGLYDYVIVKEETSSSVTIRGYFVASKGVEASWSSRASLTYSNNIQGRKLVNEGQNWLLANTGGEVFSGLLDEYGGAAAAYSLRKLSSTYSGDAIVVRRSSDNATQSIGFVNNELDTSTLNSFCSGANGFVTTWFDQSGNGFDAANTTASQQPKIYDSTNGIVLENGKPALEWTDGQIIGLQADFGQVYTQPNNFFVVHKKINNPSYLFDGIDFANRNAQFFASLFAGASLAGAYPISKTGNYNLLTVLFNTTDSKSYINTQLQVSGDVGTSGLSGVTIGTRLNFSNSNDTLDGTMQEFIIYNSNQSSNRTGIETNINDFYSIY